MKGQQNTSGNLALKPKKVIVIEANAQAERQRLRVAAYCRVSSDSSDQINSFMAQTNYYATLIASKENWTMVDVYADAGISGLSAEKRQDFQRLLEDCRKGRVDKILVKSISRFARNTRDCLSIIRELKSIGVGVCFEEQGIDTSQMSGELLTAMFAAIAQKESESISGNMRWSYQRRMERGEFITCKAPFGYRLVNGKLEIVEPEAAIIRTIFAQYLTGQSKDEIAAYVSTLGVPTRDGKQRWQHTTISYILRNEKYVGDSLLQKKYTTDTLPYQEKINHGERQQYFLPDSHPPIIDRDTFQAVTELLNRRAEKVSTDPREYSPFTKKIICGSCGTLFKRTRIGKIDYWVCRNHYRSKKNCPVARVPEKELQAAFLRLYHKLKIHGPVILTQMLNDLQAIREQRMLWSADIVELNKKISDIADQNQMLADMNKLGLVDPDIFMSQSNELVQQLQAAKQEKERLINSRDDGTIPKTREFLEMLESMPDFLPIFDSEIFGDLVERITVEHDDRLRFRLCNGLTLTERIERVMR